ncbi:hypothetical protein EON64_02390 [archaeon]|nr:MAG: hypothetical protein EON64_02390 [archaeon]
MLRFPDCQFGKHELAKKKHTEEHDEGWVQCESCQRWVHQVCSLFNSRRNVGDEVSFVCPTCLCAKRKTDPEKVLVMPTTKKMKASDLPVTTLSEFLEKRIFKRLQIAYEETAEKLNISLDNVDKCPPLVLRQVGHHISLPSFLFSHIISSPLSSLSPTNPHPHLFLGLLPGQTAHCARGRVQPVQGQGIPN